MFKRKCKVTFIAHGATIHSEENRLFDKENYPPLNDAGEEEIQKICEWLVKREIKNDKIYASSALRTIQSAQLIAKTFKTDFEILDDLSARKFGIWSGMTFEQIEEKYPQMLEQMHQNPTSFFPKDGETITDFNKRTNKIIKKIVNKNIGNRIIIVTHPDVIRSAIVNAIELPAKNQGKVYIKTGSATQISYFDTWSSLVYSGYVPL